MYRHQSLSKLSFLPLLYRSVALLLIVVIGFWLRWYRLDTAPKGALIDELHFGYIAQSLLTTGQDEHRQSWPIIFEGFGDRKLPAYGYMLLPFIQTMGMEILTIRIPSLLAGTFLILAMYWLCLELGLPKKYGLWSALLVAVSPWSLFLSRFGFESNLALLYWVAGLALLIRASRAKTIGWLAGAAVALGLTWYAYIAYRPVMLAVVGIYLVALWRWRRLTLKHLAIFGVATALTLAPLFSPQAISVNGTRLNQVGILSDPGVVMRIKENRYFCSLSLPRKVCDLVWNKPIVTGQVLLDRYLHTYSPQYLATQGEKDLVFLSVQGFGQFPSVVYPLLILGMIWLVTGPWQKSDKKSLFSLEWPEKLLLTAGLFVSPLPAIMAGDPQKVRISMLLPFMIIAIVLGLKLVEDWLPQLKLKYLATVLLVAAIAVQTFWYQVDFTSVHTVRNEYFYQSYVPELSRFIGTKANDSLIVIVPYYSDPLMFYAFYTKMDPRKYQELAVLGEKEASGFQHTVELGNVWAKSMSLESVACAARTKGLNGILVTQEELAAPTLYEAKSTNGVHTYAYAYDATAFLNASGKTCPQ
jgi:4-amino-4-deoxy-L-arabinose transferase-like glycosyltransferase